MFAVVVELVVVLVLGTAVEEGVLLEMLLFPATAFVVVVALLVGRAPIGNAALL